MNDYQGHIEQLRTQPAAPELLSAAQTPQLPVPIESSRLAFWRRVALLGIVTLIASAASYFFVDQPIAWFARHRDPATRDLARLISSPGDATWVLSASVLVLAISWAVGSKRWASRA